MSRAPRSHHQSWLKVKGRNCLAQQELGGLTLIFSTFLALESCLQLLPPSGSRSTGLQPSGPRTLGSQPLLLQIQVSRLPPLSPNPGVWSLSLHYLYNPGVRTPSPLLSQDSELWSSRPLLLQDSGEP